VFGALGTTRALSTLVGTLTAGLIGGIAGPILMLNVFQGGAYFTAGIVLLVLSSSLAVLIRSDRSEATVQPAMEA
jgi:predicted lipid-binding transport protein (Tim44 family)